MSVIKPLPEEDIDKFGNIVRNAFPVYSLSSEAEWVRFRKNMGESYESADRCLYGLYRDGELLGGMMFYDFQVNLFSSMAPAGGVGMVVVDFLHKKEKVAKEMIEFFLDHYHQRGAPLTMLYPFRPDFYKKMGWGYGAKLNEYRYSPDALPGGRSKSHVRFLTAEDLTGTIDCYNRVVEAAHGMTYKPAFHWENLYKNDNRVVGYERNGRIQGYLIYSFDKGKNFLINDLIVGELIYENREALSELTAFLRSQFDQVRQIVMPAHDDTFHHLLRDPRNGTGNIINPVSHESNVQGAGLMYRVINIPGIFETMTGRNFGGQTCRIRINLTDSFFPRQAGSTVLAVESGRARVVADGRWDVEISLDISDFSSLLMGVIGFEKLYTYHLVEVSDPACVELLDRLFFVDKKPVCITRF